MWQEIATNSLFYRSEFIQAKKSRRCMHCNPLMCVTDHRLDLSL